MRILVTGIAGAIGSNMALKLLAAGNDVIGIDSITPYYSSEIKKINARDCEEKGAEIHYIDLVKDNITDLVQDTDAIFHFAAQPGISEKTSFDDYLKNNLVATHKLLEEVKKNKKLHGLIFASTSSVYGKHANGDEDTPPKPTSNYGVTKLAAEQLALSYYREMGIPVVSLRLFSVYGERERPEKLFHKLIKAMCEDAEFPLFDGSEKHVRSYTYIRDILDGCMMVLKNLDKTIGTVINLGNDRTSTTGEGIKIIENIFNKKAKLKVISKRLGDQLETAANISKARSIFGYDPKVNLEEGLKNEVEWYKQKIFGKVK